MTVQLIIDVPRAKFGPQKICAAFADDKHPRVHITAGARREVAAFLRHEPNLRMEWLADLSGVDYAADGQMCVVYDLWSFDYRHTLAVKVFCPRARPHAPSVVDLWAAANWHEREA